MIRILIQDIKIIPQIVLAAKRVRTSSTGGWICFGGKLSGRVSSEGSQIQVWLSGRVSSEVSSDVCMGEGSQFFWVRFGFVPTKIDETFPCYLGSMLVQCYVL